MNTSPAGNSRDAGHPPVGGHSLADRGARLLSAAIQIPSVNPPGGEAAVAQLFVDELRRSGIEAELVPTPSPEQGPRRAAAWARVPGRGSAPPLLLLSHLDVVGARGTGWNEDPFAGTIRRGQVIGRGALDAKGLTVVHALTLETLARRQVPLERDVILLATPDEEAGGKRGLGWILRERPELLGGVEYALAEGGSIRRSHSRASLWSISIAEKSPCWLELRTYGTPGHGGIPAPDAAVPRLIAALERIRLAEWPLHVVPEVERMFRSLAAAAPQQERVQYQDLGRALSGDPDFRRRFLRHRSNAALVRNTLSITVLEGAPHTNVVPAEARAQLDARLLPGERCDAFQQRVREIAADPALTIEPLLSHPATSSSIDTPLFRAIEQLAREVDPGAPVVAQLSAGSSDAHWLRQRGIITYGFVPRWLEAEDTRGIHGPDEHISIDNIERGTRSLVRLLEILDEVD